MPIGPRPPSGVVNHFWFPRYYYHHHHAGFYPYYLGTFSVLYPFYYPMYYYPDTYYSEPGYDDYPYANGGVAPVQPGTQATVSAYYRLGHDWGQDLRNDVVTWNQFVDYIRTRLLSLPEAERTQFRQGFIAGYGMNAGEALDKAWASAAQAAPQSGNAPATSVPPPPTPNAPPAAGGNSLPPAVEEK